MKAISVLTLPLLMVLMGFMSAAGQNVAGYEFISPKPGSVNNSLASTIIIRHGDPIDKSSLSADGITVLGSRTGSISGGLILSPDGKTLIFKPEGRLPRGEAVEVTIHSGISTNSRRPLEAGRFTFQTTAFDRMPNPYDHLDEFRPNIDESDRPSISSSAGSQSSGFPPMEVEMIDSSAVGDGYIFLAVASDVEGIGYYLMMLNNDATPFFSTELEHDYAYDFKMQPNGQLSYAHFFEHHSYTGGGNVVHKIMDSSLTLVDSVQMGNGYVAEAHDFQILPNGHYLLFGYYLTPVDMSQLVEGGRPDALVSGGVVQELDADKNVVFQWRSWDHFTFEDWTFNSRQATRSIVSEFHLNTINLDDDGHLFVATPQWVKKINRQTGNVVWNLGGQHNEFSFTNVDSAAGLDMVGGHMFHRLPNKNVLLYDNGNRQGTKSSRVHEFGLDEDNKSLELVWSYEPDSLVAGWHRGNAQRLPNGNTVIGWGGSSGKPSPAMTEVDPDGRKVYELSFVPPAIESYRAFRFPFTGGEPAASVILTEVAPGNTYDFSEGDSVFTGVSIEVNDLSGTGYNELTVERYNHAPITPLFASRAPRVEPTRMVLRQFGLTSIKADVMFDITSWGIRQPNDVVVFHREFEGKGLFVPVPTTYNPVKEIVVATADRTGEFILTTPDFESVVFTPWPVSPVDSAEVNQTLPLTLEWTPVGFVDTYDLQVGTERVFSINTIVDDSLLTDARYVLDQVEVGRTYYWRVRSSNDAGKSEWTKLQMFTTVAPFVDLLAPAGGDVLERGLDFLVRWNDNIEEDVVLELHLHDSIVDTIAVTPSDGAFEWEVGVDLESGPGYSIKIISSVDGAISDINSESFNIAATTAIGGAADESVPTGYGLHQSYPNPFNPATRISFDLPVAEHAMLTIYDMRGRRIMVLTDGHLNAGVHSVVFDAAHLPSGTYLYRLETPSYSEVRHMVLIK